MPTLGSMQMPVANRVDQALPSLLIGGPALREESKSTMLLTVTYKFNRINWQTNMSLGSSRSEGRNGGRFKRLKMAGSYRMCCRCWLASVIQQVFSAAACQESCLDNEQCCTKRDTSEIDVPHATRGLSGDRRGERSKETLT